MTMLETALQWHDRGVAVLPIRPGSKRAAIAWHDYQSTPPTKPQIIKWFAGRRHNLAVICGAVSGNLCILDFDSLPRYLQWCKTHPVLACSYTVATPRPGSHIYLYADNLDGNFETPFDLKRSGYVLAAPSVHPSGRPYIVAINRPILRVGYYLADALAEYLVKPSRRRDKTPNMEDANLLCQGRVAGDVIREVKANLSITELLSEYTTLRPSDPTGRYWLCRCPMPWHEDEDPSFWADAVTGRCSCFVPWCRAKFGGRALDVVGLFAKLERLTLRQAMARLAQRLGL